MSCVEQIRSAAPMVVNYNTRDASQVTIPVEPIPLPQHLPLWIIQSERGEVGSALVPPSELGLRYGDISLSEVGPYTNHQTIGLIEAATQANTCIVHRVSNGTRANLILSLDIIQTDIEMFQRDQFGRFVLDTAGVPISQGVVPGHLAKWRLSSQNNWNPATLGNSVPTVGNLPGGSMSFPILELAEEYPGQFGNNVGIKIYSPGLGDVDEREMIDNNAFPFKFSIIERVNRYTTPKAKHSIYGEKVVDVSFSPNATSSIDGTSYKIDEVIRERYSNTTDRRYAKMFGDYVSYVHLYEENIKTVLTDVFTMEKNYIEAQAPGFLSTLPLDNMSPAMDRGEEYLFNLVGGEDKDFVPYYTFAFDDDTSITDSIKLTRVTNVYAAGAEDNVMSVTDYERAVRDLMDTYQDCSNSVQDLARNPESILYDTGFGFDTKKILTKFISQRPDTFLVLQTHYDTTNVRGWNRVADPLPLPPDWVVPEIANLSKIDELSIGSALRTAVLLQPESTYFGTQTFRSLIFTNSGVFRNRGWKNRVGFSFYLIAKAAAYMGASNGQWKSGQSFSRAPGNIVDNLTDVNTPWIPADTRIRYWDVGLNFPLTYDLERLFMPALQTVYPDDTSVLNSFNTSVAICYLYKIAYRAWREFSGTDDLTGADLITAVNTFVTAEVRDRFDGRYIVQSDAYLSVDDERRGYSWTLNIKLFSGTMYTVEKLIIESHRFDSLANGGQ